MTYSLPLTTNFFAIIVAGGSGSRMKSSVPKQFLLFNGKPILQHTIERFLAVPVLSSESGTHERRTAVRLILVLPARDLITWQQLCEQHQFYPSIQTVAGGTTRFQSVRNGLNAIDAANGIVAVHDGVRPFVSPDIITVSYTHLTLPTKA